VGQPQVIEGGCLCGAVRYQIAGPLGDVVHCHCAMCRKSSGAPVVTWISVAAGCFAFTSGEPSVHRSSSHAERRFCGGCGAQLTFWSERDPQNIDVTLGTLDEPERHPAIRHIWTGSRLPWIQLDKHLPDYAEESPSGS